MRMAVWIVGLLALASTLDTSLNDGAYTRALAGMESEGVSFPEAVERLAQMAGVPLPQVSREDEARDARRKTLHDVMELAAKFFQDTLASRNGAKARGYLADRGLDGTTQLKFRLGYATNERFALKEHLGSHGIPVEDMQSARSSETPG